jgi:hypothetical protein
MHDRRAASMTPEKAIVPTERRDIFAPELEPGEMILWRGRPDPRRLFSRSDRYLVPLTIVLAAICFPNLSINSIGLGAAALPILVLYLIAILAAIYLLVGRFVYKRETRACTHYAVSDRRILTANTLWGRRFRSQALAGVAAPRLESRGPTGSIYFTGGRDVSAWGESTGVPSLSMWRSSRVPAFHDAANATEAFAIILARRQSTES